MVEAWLLGPRLVGVMLWVLCFVLALQLWPHHKLFIRWSIGEIVFVSWFEANFHCIA